MSRRQGYTMECVGGGCSRELGRGAESPPRSHPEQLSKEREGHKPIKLRSKLRVP